MKPMRQLLVLLVLTAASAAFADSPELVSAARQQTRSAVTYDGSYARVGYPGPPVVPQVPELPQVPE